jgi:uncharacterized protein (TIGR03643 family)
MKTTFTAKDVHDISPNLQDKIIRAAWEDDVSFDSILLQYGLKEQAVIKIMKIVMKHSMFVKWRKRVLGRAEKHLKKKTNEEQYILDSSLTTL